MNAGGSVFWVALAVSLALAVGATCLFLSPGDDDAMEISEDSGAGDAPGTQVEEEFQEAISDPDDGHLDEVVEADVTFSFARKVAELSEGVFLEQDDLHRVYCRDAAGETLWEYLLGDSLIGAIEVDANDDGKVEYLLVDSQRGVGLDSEGTPISGFLIQPSAPISCVAMVDYDGDGKERYLFGLEDGRVLNYRMLGEATPGWQHQSKGEAVQVIAHLRTGRKDYICTVDRAGVVMLLKRNGQRRLRTPVQFHRQAGRRPVAFDIRSDIESSVIISRNADGAIESRLFGDGVPRTASMAEGQLLEIEELRWDLD